MHELWAAAAWAGWLGVLSAISPCPLAGNIAAISYVARRVGKVRLALLSGVLFAAGQVLAYVGVAGLVMWAALASDEVAAALQRYLSKAMGPLLVVAGVLLLELLPFSFGGVVSQRLRKVGESMGVGGSLLLGMLLALAFCPTTAALYFGSVLPMALRLRQPVVVVAYGAGVAAPVMTLAIVLALAAHRVGAAYGRLAAFERWGRRATGVAFVGAGVYLSLVHVYRVL